MLHVPDTSFARMSYFDKCVITGVLFGIWDVIQFNLYIVKIPFKI